MFPHFTYHGVRFSRESSRISASFGSGDGILTGDTNQRAIQPGPIHHPISPTLSGLPRSTGGVSNQQTWGSIMRTPWKINMEPENDGLEDDFPFQLGGF